MAATSMAMALTLAIFIFFRVTGAAYVKVIFEAYIGRPDLTFGLHFYSYPS